LDNFSFSNFGILSNSKWFFNSVKDELEDCQSKVEMS